MTESKTIYLVFEFTRPKEGGDIDRAFEAREAADRYVAAKSVLAAKLGTSFPAIIVETELFLEEGAKK